MVLIFGWGSDAKDLGEVAPAVCPNCHNQVLMHQVHSQKQVSLYFVPIVPYGSNEYLACPICRQGLQVRAEQKTLVDKMRVATRVFRQGGMSQDYYLAQADVFWRQIGVTPSGQQVVRPPSNVPAPAAAEAEPTGEAGAASAASAASAPTLSDRLNDLARLHDQGVVTDEEFAALKRRILGI